MTGAEAYLLKRLAVGAALVTAALAGLLWLGLVLRHADKVIGEGVPVSLFLKLAVLALPAPLALALPVGILVGTLWCYGAMARDSELVALRTAGLADGGLLRPAGLVGLAGLLAGLLIAAELAPRAAQALRAEQLDLRASLGRAALAQGGFVELTPGLALHAGRVDSGGRIHSFIAHDGRAAGQTVTLLAREAIARSGEDGLELLLRDGLRQERDRASGRIQTLAFDSFRFVVRRDVDKARRRLDPDALPLSTLLARLADDKEGAADAARLRAELGRRLVTPLLSPAFALLAAALFVRRTRLPDGARRLAGLAGLGACLLAAASFGLAQLAAHAALFGWLALALPILAALLSLLLASLPHHAPEPGR
ncbi:MAG: LptF/LptG family permease [Alphaproteobacteria bacterium]|nr:LptF/LptG family permease [Alphaproteobacteria bacterium]